MKATCSTFWIAFSMKRKALVIVRNCKLALPPATASDHETNAALNGDCELDWLTAHRPGGKG